MKQREPKRPSWKLWVAAGGVILFCAIGFVVWQGPSMFLGDQSSVDGGSAERTALVTVDDFLSQGHVGRKFESEHCSRQGERSLLGSINLHYVYVCGVHPDPRPVLSIRSSAYLFDYCLLGGRDMSSGHWRALTTDFEEDTKREFSDTPSVTWQHLKDFGLGDESRCALAFDGAKPVGFFFLCRVGERILDLNVRGSGFADSVAAEAFLAPQVAEFREYVP